MATAFLNVVPDIKCPTRLLLGAMRILVFDGGRSRERGCYGSWAILEWVACEDPAGCKRKRKRCPENLWEFTVYSPCPESRRRLAERCTFDLPDLRTSNEAEWASLCRGLLAVQEHGAMGAVAIVGDSRLVLNQFTGRWRVWAENLRPLYQEAQELAGELRERGCELFCEWRPRHVTAAYLGH